MRRALSCLAVAAALGLSSVASAQTGAEGAMADARAASRRGDEDAALAAWARVLDAPDATPLMKGEALDATASYQFLVKHDLDAAMSAMDAAVALFPGDPHYLTLRGVYRTTAGQPAQGLPDLDEAVRVAPGSLLIRRARGFTLLHLGRFVEAAADMRLALKAQDYSPFLPLELHVVRMRTGVDDRIEFGASTERFDPKVWPGPIVAFYRGDLAAEAVIAAADASPSADRTGNLCEAYYFIGQAATAAGELANAKGLFEQAVAICPFDFTEGAGAKAELSRMR